MKKNLYPANERGHADHGWLNAWHSFSFAGWYDEKKIHFGMLRVLNDDAIAPGRGFGMHPHDNMEIVTIPLKGTLEHKDNMGNSGQIRFGEIQAMSAGTGVYHSEYNPSEQEETRLFQVWIFPKLRNIQPRYAQKTFPLEERINKLQLVVSPEQSDATLWINQDAYFSLGSFKKGTAHDYSLKIKGNGVYVMIIEGKAKIAGETLGRRDALGIWEAEDVKMEFEEDAEILVIEVPMN